MRIVESVGSTAAGAARATRGYLASDRGRQLRHRVATVVIVGAPIVAELPGVRRHPVARFVRAAGVVALMVKGAEWLRDWDPEPGMGETVSV